MWKPFRIPNCTLRVVMQRGVQFESRLIIKRTTDELCLFSAGARDSYRLQKCPKEAVGSTQPSSEMILPADKTRWRDVDQLFPSSPEAMNEQTYTFTPPCTFVTCTGAIVIFFFTLIYSLLLFSLFPSSHCYFRQCQCPIWDSIKTKVNRV